MNPDTNPDQPHTPDEQPSTETSASEQSTTPPEQAPADALSRTPDELADEEAQQAADHPVPEEPPAKKAPLIKRIFRRVNIYFLIFLLILVIAAAVAIVNYLNSQKPPVEPAISSQELTQDALKQLQNTDATVGNTSQTLTIQGNAIIAGQTLMRGDLNVAGNFQTGGSIKGPSITISGDSNFGKTQADSLQVKGSLAIQGDTTLRNLNVAGTSSFSGAMTASQITVTNLILSGNATLEIPNHIRFSGPSPSRSTGGALGGGGSVSIDGSDTSGTININTGNSPAPGCFARITFHQAFTHKPHVLVSPVGSAAGRTDYYVDRDQSGFSICTATSAPAHQAFAFDYFVTN